ncbi:MAG: ThiS-like ubiquitin domain-containing protein, partial [Phycisphaerales bacterium]
MPMNTLKDLLVTQLNELCAAERRAAKLMPGLSRTVLALRARHEEPMRITVNGRSTEMPAASDAAAVRARVKPGADLVIVNGAVVEGGHPVRDGDEVTLIRRG